ncbi:hypothetical protein DFQ27_002438 [Actinomortierella ambigua]|uniref:Alpha/beta hydrolase fold-3 domain-containing protein n=1 Tax=Actinomortierella ambigua TaxID=1343610 RepID=A0A9P6Q8K3_9FUNG|nr:hypothetical protein DFQ27_002438 [Actinomortierella ambigua]
MTEIAKKVSMFMQHMVPNAPIVVGTALTHYTYGPPRPSWSLKFHLIMSLIQGYTARINDVSLKEAQAMSRLNDEYAPVHKCATATESLIPLSYRDQAAVHIDHILSKEGVDAARVGWDWKNDPRAQKPYKAEWTEVRDKDSNYKEGRTVLYLHGGGYFLCSIRTHRWATYHMARLGGAKVFAVDYRLAPDSPFPAALQDSIAAYLYLLNPPADADFGPIDPKNIVIMGDSAGGGLTFATLLAIKDAGLPMPAGIIGWSPWLDLLHSMPSLIENAGTDYLPADGFSQGDQGSLRQLAKSILNLPGEDDFHRRPELPTIQYYTQNAMLDCKYVSPILETDLKGACPIMIVSGDAEMIRDESTVFAMRHGGDHRHNKDGQGPVIQFRLYDDMPHVFMMFGFLTTAKHSMKESGDFIRAVTLGGEGPGETSRFERIDVMGNRRELEDNPVVDWAERLGKLGGGRKFLSRL